MQSQTTWNQLLIEAKQLAQAEPVLANLANKAVLQHTSFATSLAHILAHALADHRVNSDALSTIFNEVLSAKPVIVESACQDLLATKERDTACSSLVTPFLYYKGFQAIQSYRIANALWLDQRESLALFIQNRVSTIFDVDIHPAATIGYGILMDHATGVVIGETAVVANHVSIMQSVTLGGTGKEQGDRHPKIGEGVLIGPGSKILGNIHVGKCSKIAAGSVLLQSVPERSLVTGVPAKVVDTLEECVPALQMDQGIE